jgi:hypothetical protein
MGSAGCACGGGCGGAAKTGNDEAILMIAEVAREMGDSVKGIVFEYSSEAKLGAAAVSLQAAIAAAGMEVPPVTSRNLRHMLDAAGPFLAVNGELVANGSLPGKEELKEFLARRAVGESSA